jgi:NAD(P)-dependent dehydrogenase (short-subunit alcohol dehydrogenase family)
MKDTAALMVDARRYADTPYVDLLRYDGDSVVITGGAKGIGFAMADRFAELGATITLVDIDTDLESIAAALSERRGVAVHAVRGDVRDSGISDAVARDAYTSPAGRLIWVNNAGIYPTNLLEEMTDDDWSRVIDLDLTATFYGCRAAGLTIRQQGGEGVIINISSIAGFRVGNPPGISHYASAKHAVQGLTKSMAFELGRDGVRVVCIAPGTVVSDGLLAKFGPADAAGGDPYERLAQRMPIRRPSLPDDVARTAVFLASPAAAMITGAIVPVDAGHLVL